ncbi:MAG: type II toxin-antitoxin system VapC family toxin [Dermatophilaceae bacterium]|nr:type II toxin-antitoxin system VapC family toxin [Dermatophilaceae bacterium]HRB99991.1 type II toxin-antitoxin system VapC family toxin [Dermatophilaceae bacterium]
MSTRGDLVVLDASVVVDLLVAPDRPRLASVLGAHSWHAPAHLDVEVVSALRGLVLGRHLSAPRAVDALVDLADLEITRWAPDLAVTRRVLALRDRLTAYDAAYLVCAEGVDAPLATRDQRLARAADGLVEVVLL